MHNTILVLGATGYVGSRLVPYLLERGYSVRAAGRSLEKLKSLAWHHHSRVELAACDVLNPADLESACQGVQAAFYLVHSMNPGQSHFRETDHRAAANMAAAAEKAGLARLIYLAGLGEDSPDLSEHLKSRREVEAVLKSGKTPVTVLRAAMIIGSGSASFEIMRYLVERLPMMVTPRWVSTQSQPIAIRNVLHYLTECLDVPATEGEVFDIGGPEVLTYRDLMEIYTAEAHLHKRWVVPVPVLTPRLSSYWIHLVTPVHASIARPLAEGLKNKVVAHDERLRKLIPQRLVSVREAIRLALDQRQHYLLNRGPVPQMLLPPEWAQSSDPFWSGGTVFRDQREIELDASPSEIWKVLSRIGGDTGWYYADWLWQLRGLMDEWVGGVGIRKTSQSGTELRAGQPLDFWRVEKVAPAQELILIAEMKLPGRAALHFQIAPVENRPGRYVLRQTALFIPRGLSGILYWYAVAPFHHLIFAGMLKGIAAALSRP